MDKNTVIGLVLIIAVIFGFSWLNQPSKEELARRQHVRDSIAAANEAAYLAQLELEREQAVADSLAAIGEMALDSARLEKTYGYFAAAGVGVEEQFAVENEKIRLTFSNKGGRVCAAEMKNYTRYDSLPLMLFADGDASLGFTLFTSDNRIISTKSLYFEPIVSKTDEAQIVTMRLAVDADAHIDFIYTIPNDDFMTSMEIKAHNMAQYLSPNTSSLDMQWQSLIRQNEKGRKFESRYATLNYKFVSDDMERLSELRNDSEKLAGKVRWVAFKDHFFSTIMIADDAFTATAVETEIMPERSEFIKKHSMEASVAFDPNGARSTKFHTYYGPNQYRVLKSYDKHIDGEDKLRLQHIIPMGWSLFRWITTCVIIPVFNFLGKYIGSYGLIIFLLTIIIKLVILPFTFKSYMSSAKMRVLRPQIDEINARIPAEKAMERQQATMALYQKAGVSPMSGCLPMLFQMPILFAMFSFFPTAFELRGQSFLWADDLSSYDAIISWNTYIPLITPYFGNHISLFCLLMTVTNIIYTKINMATTGAGDQPGAGMMKTMMYMMPVMFMFIFNNYASGLSYYYFVSLLITILQTYLFRLFVDDKKVLAQLEKNKTKPQKKSGFMQRLEEAQKAQQQALREQQARQMKSNSKGRH